MAGVDDEPSALPAAARPKPPTRPSILVAQAAGLATKRADERNANPPAARPALETRPSVFMAREAGLAGLRREEIENKEDEEEALEREGSAGVRESVMEHVAGLAGEKTAEFETKNEEIRGIKESIAKFHEKKSEGGGDRGGVRAAAPQDDANDHSDSDVESMEYIGLIEEFHEEKSEGGDGGRAAAPQDDANDHGHSDAVVDVEREAEALEYIMSLIGENGKVFETRDEAIRVIRGLLAESKDQEKKLTRAMVYTSIRKLYKPQESLPLVSTAEDANEDDSAEIDPWSAGDDEGYNKFLRFLKDGGEIR